MSRSVSLRVNVLAACLAACSGVLAHASPRDEDLFIRPEDQHTVIFGSLDAGRSVFASGGAKQTLTGPLDRPGFVAMETTGFGLTRESIKVEGAKVPVVRFVHETSALLGHQWTLGPVYIAAYAGPEIHQQQVAVDGRVSRFSRPRLGARGQVEVWAHPTPETLLTGTLVAGSVRSSVWARASAGWRLSDKAYLGPEVTVYATPTYSEVRWGAHVTGVALGIVNLRLSGGWMHDDAHRHGSPYAGLSAWIRL